MESLKKAKDFGNGSKKEPDGDDGTVPARKAYVGKHRSQSVPAKGTPPQAKEYGSLAAADGDGAGACVEEEEEEEEADDQVPDWGGDPPKEGKRRKKNKKKSKSRSRARKEDPAAKRDPDDPQDPKDPKDPPPAAATASA